MTTRSSRDESSSHQRSVLGTPKKLQYSQRESPKRAEESANDRIEGSLKRLKMGDGSFDEQSSASGTATSSDADDFFASNITNAAFDSYPTLESVGSDVQSEVSVSHLRGWLDDFGKQQRNHFEQGGLSKADSMDSDCASDVSSVVKLKGWLDDFGKQNKKHFDKVHHAPDGETLESTTKKGPTKTPVRFRARHRKEDVQATNDAQASVKKLSAWLADNPTSEKKLLHVRKGMNVIAKSRAFEKDLANVVVEENNIVRGSVSQKKKLLQSSTLVEPKESDQALSQVSVTQKKNLLAGGMPHKPVVSVKDRQRWLKGALNETQERDVEQEGVDEDKSVVSVSDKKRWLQNAFKKVKEEKGADVTKVDSRAKNDPKEVKSTDVAPLGDFEEKPNEPVASSNVRSTSRLSLSQRKATPWKPTKSTEETHLASDSITFETTREAEPELPTEAVIQAPSSDAERSTSRQSLSQRKATPWKPSKSMEETHYASDSADTRETETELPTTTVIQAPSADTEREPSTDTETLDRPAPPVRQISSTRVDFKTARRLLVERSQQNGHPTKLPARSSVPNVAIKKSEVAPVVAAEGLTKTEASCPSSEFEQEAPSRPAPPDRQDSNTPLDFKAARRLLVERSVQNGNPIKAITAVDRRKAKFERLEKENRRKSAAHGLLKTSWAKGDPSADRPSSGYTKTFVSDIAPKKSFEELP